MKSVMRSVLGVLFAAVFAVLAVMPQGVEAAPAAPNCNIVYQFADGNTYTIDGTIAMSLMMTNADGSFYIDPATNYYVVDANKLLTFLNALQAMYPQKSNALDFWSTTDGVIHYTSSAFNNRYINVPREMAYLPQAIMSGANEIHSPEMSVGNTYVEIDISSQHLYYYENLELKFESDVVTGNTRLGHNTPTGVYYLRARATNQTLTGANYASFVSYWMPFIGNSIGMHDATWRSSFGGNIYTYNGSHGCVNMPKAKAAALFNMIKTGTPVIVHQ